MFKIAKTIIANTNVKTAQKLITNPKLSYSTVQKFEPPRDLEYAKDHFDELWNNNMFGSWMNDLPDEAENDSDDYDYLNDHDMNLLNREYERESIESYKNTQPEIKLNKPRGMI